MPAHGAVIEVHRKIRVMVLAMRHPADGVDESQRLQPALESVSAGDCPNLAVPTRQHTELIVRLRVGVGVRDS